jgi:peptide/nickel transport system permease protein
MSRYLLARAAHSLVLLLVLSAVSFALLELAPGRYLDEMRIAPDVPPAAVEAWQARLKLNRPASLRYFEWLSGAVRGDFGLSFSNNRPVLELIRERVGKTLALGGASLLLAWLVGAPLGVRSAMHRGQGGVMAALQAIPDVVIALGLMYAAVRSGWLGVEGWKLPLAAMVLTILPVVWRHTRAACGEALQAPFVQGAVADGIPQGRLVACHVLPVAACTLIPLFGVLLGRLMSISLLVEIVMGWPGLGSLLMDAVLGRDAPLMLGAVVCSGAMIVAGNLAADVALYWADPRIRAE